MQGMFGVSLSLKVVALEHNNKNFINAAVHLKKKM